MIWDLNKPKVLLTWAGRSPTWCSIRSLLSHMSIGKTNSILTVYAEQKSSTSCMIFSRVFAKSGSHVPSLSAEFLKFLNVNFDYNCDLISLI